MKSAICSDCNSVTGGQKRHKHIWMYSTYCDTCNCDDFDTWLQEEKDKVVHDLVIGDFNHMVRVMANEGKFNGQIALEIFIRMKELARTRGYLRLPWEKQQEGNEESTVILKHAQSHTKRQPPY